MRAANSRADHYGVMGNPIGHSKSPLIHRLFARETDQALEYEAILVPQGEFPRAAEEFQMRGGRGLNVTLPFKQDAWRWVDRRSERAELAGAVNTIILEPNSPSRGDNTDGVGLVRDLTINHDLCVGGRRVLVLGAGGAVRGVLPSLLADFPETLVIANRTVSKARDLATRFSAFGTLSACGFENLAGERFDLIINGTAASLSGQLPPLPEGLLVPGGGCYDMAYASEPTAFVRWGRHQGAAHSLDGLGMLVEQAAESFYLWRGVRPDTRPVIERLRG